MIPSMDRDIEDIGVFIKDLLSAVPMTTTHTQKKKRDELRRKRRCLIGHLLYIPNKRKHGYTHRRKRGELSSRMSWYSLPINDQYLFDLVRILVQRCQGRHSHIVKETESHGCTFFGMMAYTNKHEYLCFLKKKKCITWRSNESKAIFQLSLYNSIYQGDQRACCHFCRCARVRGMEGCVYRDAQFATCHLADKIWWIDDCGCCCFVLRSFLVSYCVSFVGVHYYSPANAS